jgi:hypothetical protein
VLAPRVHPGILTCREALASLAAAVSGDPTYSDTDVISAWNLPMVVRARPRSADAAWSISAQYGYRMLIASVLAT